MAKGTVLVASPSATASTPVAIGSSVPAWPAFCASKTRLTAPTTCVEVTPDGLSTITQPCTAEPFFLRGIAEPFDPGREQRHDLFHLRLVSAPLCGALRVEAAHDLGRARRADAARA